MQNTLLTIVLLALLALAALLVFNAGTFMDESINPYEPETDGSLTEDTSTNPDSVVEHESEPTADNLNRENWERFQTVTNAGVTLTLSYPPAATMDEVAPGIYELKYIGSNSEAATEITDGYYLSFQFATGTTMTEYLANQETIGPVTAETMLTDRAARRYQSRSELSGELVDHLVITLPGGESAGVLNIAEMTYGAKRPRYEAIVAAIIASVQLSTASE